MPLPIEERTIVGGSQAGPVRPAANAELVSETSTATQTEHKVPENFFIVKSLTVQSQRTDRRRRRHIAIGLVRGSCEDARRIRRSRRFHRPF